MSLSDILSIRRRNGRCAFIPFLIAGDPSLPATGRFLKALTLSGADIIEVGVPFSDPVADGPAIQAAGQRALGGGVSLRGTLDLIGGLRRGGWSTPVVLFTYVNPILALGLKSFARLCARAGVDGVLAVDLPVEEAGPLLSALRSKGIEAVVLASPTTSAARLKAIGRASGSIVYYVSREGVTGARRGLAPGLARRLREVRRLTGKALIVGFGVSTREQARGLAAHADGVVVGSALVEAVSRAGGVAAAARALRLKAREIVSGLSL